MAVMLPRRLLRALIAVAVLLASALPGMALPARPVMAGMPSCAGGHATGPGCSSQADKVMACGAAACAGIAIAVPAGTPQGARPVQAVVFPPGCDVAIAGASLPPDPFPPRA